MQFQSFRSAVVIASVLVASVTASQAIAQTPIDVFTGLTDQGSSIVGNLVSTYNFTQSMVLNSIGFVSSGNNLTTIQYKLNGVSTSLFRNPIPLDVEDANGLRWYTLPNGGLSVNALSQLVITAKVTVQNGPSRTFLTNYVRVDSLSSSSNVTYGGLTGEGKVFANHTNSNLRVSSPTSNVAPEPGTFALALTGGAALLGICIRRRRNAA
jgi:hypothetical protein